MKSMKRGKNATVTILNPSARLPLLATAEPRILKSQKLDRPCAFLLKLPQKKAGL